MASDYGHEQTDKTLAELEKRIQDVYKQAHDELQKTVDAYFDAFWERDSKMRAQLEAGEITADYYREWRLAQIGRGERFEALRDVMAQRYTQANEVAVSYVNDTTPGIYALNHNYMAYTIERVAGDIGFTLFDEQTVRRLIVEQPNLMPNYPAQKAIKRGIDLAWGKKQITASVTSGILQGHGVKQVADDLQKRIETMNRESAIRTARTALTGAENAGRLDGLGKARDRGIDVQKEWVATMDGRTRHSHRVVDGETVDQDKKFSNGLRYPGDPAGPGREVYNCRCTMVGALKGVREAEPTMRRVRNPETGEYELIPDMSYSEWEKWKKGQTNSSNRDILKSTQLKALPITDDAINAVPLVQPKEWSVAAAKKLQQESQALLRTVKNEPLGTEAGCVYDTSMNRLIDIRLGKPGDNRVYLPSANAPHVTVHTHPDGEIFSGTDIENFLYDASQTTMVVITNAGKMFCVHKTNAFDGLMVVKSWLQTKKALDKCAANNDVDAYIKQIRTFLQEAGKYGTQFIEK